LILENINNFLNKKKFLRIFSKISGNFFFCFTHKNPFFRFFSGKISFEALTPPFDKGFRGYIRGDTGRGEGYR
jgi:hypothetical protein